MEQQKPQFRYYYGDESEQFSFSFLISIKANIYSD